MSLPPSFFDAMYAAADDPWSMRTRWYERRKYALTTAVLPRERYAEGLEVGCSVGELTARLAERCDRLTGWDASAAAVGRAAERVAGTGHVRIEQAAVPARPLRRSTCWCSPRSATTSTPRTCSGSWRRCAAAVRPGGTLVAVHWRHPVPEYPQTRRRRPRGAAGGAAWPRVAVHEEPDLLLDCWVAAAAGRRPGRLGRRAEHLW